MLIVADPTKLAVESALAGKEDSTDADGNPIIDENTGNPIQVYTYNSVDKAMTLAREESIEKIVLSKVDYLSNEVKSLLEENANRSNEVLKLQAQIVSLMADHYYTVNGLTDVPESLKVSNFSNASALNSSLENTNISFELVEPTFIDDNDGLVLSQEDSEEVRSFITRSVSSGLKIDEVDLILKSVNDGNGNLDVYATINVDLKENHLKFNNTNMKFYYDDATHQVLDFIRVNAPANNDDGTLGVLDNDFKVEQNQTLERVDDETRRHLTVSIPSVNVVDQTELFFNFTANYDVNNMLLDGTSFNITVDGEERSVSLIDNIYRLSSIAYSVTEVSSEVHTESKKVTNMLESNLNPLLKEDGILDAEIVLDLSPSPGAEPQYTIKLPSQGENQDATMADGANHSVVMKLYIGDKDTGDNNNDPNNHFIYQNFVPETVEGAFGSDDITINTSRLSFNESVLKHYSSIGKIGAYDSKAVKMRPAVRNETYQMFMHVEQEKNDGGQVDSENATFKFSNLKPELSYQYVKQMGSFAVLIPQHVVNSVSDLPALSDVTVVIECESNGVRVQGRGSASDVIYMNVSALNNSLVNKTLKYTVEYYADNIKYVVKNQEQLIEELASNVSPLKLLSDGVSLKSTSEQEQPTVSQVAQNTVHFTKEVSSAQLTKMSNATGSSALNVSSQTELNVLLANAGRPRTGNYNLNVIDGDGISWNFLINFA